MPVITSWPRPWQTVRLRRSPRLHWRLHASPLRPPVALVAGFALLIAVGTVFLMLPISARQGRADLLTALFTATSAVCVTGLTVVDTGSYWSPFGQVIVMFLMEIGGLGFMIGVTAVALFLRGRISLRQRLALQQSGSTARLGEQGNLIWRTILFTLACELVGTLILWTRFLPDYGAGRGLWLALFHAVSAFTNGSFDLFGRSLAAYRADPVVLLTVATLIAVGGLSLLVVEDLGQTRRWRRLALDTKVVVSGTALLLAGGTALVYLAERDNPASLGTLPLGHQLVNAFFHAAAARTAGFSTWDFALSDERSLFFLTGLMYIGGAPGSMAGGVKITTMAALAAGAWGALRGAHDATLFARRVPERLIGQALAVAVLALGLIANVALAISLLEGARLHAPFLHLIFEVTSAFGTVGFSTGLTPTLAAPGKLLLVLTMFVGRLGPVTVALTLTARRHEARYRLPSEPLRIG